MSSNTSNTGSLDGDQPRDGPGGGGRGGGLGGKRGNSGRRNRGRGKPKETPTRAADSVPPQNARPPPPSGIVEHNMQQSQQGGQGVPQRGGWGGDRGRQGAARNPDRHLGFLPPPPSLGNPSYGNSWTRPPQTASDGAQGGISGGVRLGLPQGSAVGEGNRTQGSAHNPGSGRGRVGRGRDSSLGRGFGGAQGGNTSYNEGVANVYPTGPPAPQEHLTWAEFRAQSRGRGRGHASGGFGDRGPGQPGGVPQGNRGRGGDRRGRGRAVDGLGRGRGRSSPSAPGDRRGYERGQQQTPNFGRGGGVNRSPPRLQEELPPPRDLMEGILVPALERLMPPDVDVPDKPISIEGFRCLGSYTWHEHRDPTIFVPGLPREWLDRLLPVQVRSDNGIRMLDENKYHMGSNSPLVPLFRAIDSLQAGDRAASAEARDTDTPPQQTSDTESGVDWAAVDFVTDRNNLRKFLRWIRESHKDSDTTSPANPPAGNDGGVDQVAEDVKSTATPDTEWDVRKDFRVDLYLGGEKTVLMERWVPFDRERVSPPKGGCRDNFIREATAHAPECAGGAGHYRIVQYNLEGLNLVIRWEVDAYMPSSTTPPLSSTSSTDSAESTSPVELPPPAVDINELARWDPTDPGGADAWGPPALDSGGLDEQLAEKTAQTTEPPCVETAISIDELAKWDDSIPNATDWSVPSNDTAPPASPIGETSAMNLQTAMAMWDAPDDDPAAAAAAWGAAPAGNNPATPSGSESMLALPGAASAVVSDLKVVRAGTLLPQSSLLELAARSAHYLDRTSAEDTFIQLFLTQTPVNLVAVHTRGCFERVIRQELDAPEYAKFVDDTGMQKYLQQLVELLRKIQEMVKQHGQPGRVSLVCEKGQLGLYSRVGEDSSFGGELARFEV